MKVKIGKYLNYWGPYQIVDAIFFWHKKNPFEEEDLARENRWDHKLHTACAKWLADVTWFCNLCEWIHEKRKRTVKVHIDNYDVWSMDHTLSLIVVPMLKKLKGCKHGAPNVDLKDVPKHLHPTAEEAKHAKETYETDPKFFQRWEWVLDEMIWAHEQLLNDDHDAQFWIDHGEIDWNAGEPDENGLKPIVWKKKSKIDWKGLKAHNKRIGNGLRLFGVYYRSLWD